MSELGLFECLLSDPVIGGSSFSEVVIEPQLESSKMDILSTSLHENGILGGGNQNENWTHMDSDTDALLDSILTGNELLSCDLQTASSSLDGPLSDTSSDSGCNLEQQLSSPEPTSNNGGLDLIDFISSGNEDETPLQAVNPRTNSPEPETVAFETGTTTIILPVITSQKCVKTSGASSQLLVKAPPSKRRRISASSSDSGLDDISTPTMGSNGKYPALDLNEEEKRLCEREGIKLPSHYPLTREEEKNLKRIRRKIRNKVSAQDSRKRKKEYLDNMEDRVRACTEENDELHKRIEQLETQNKTLAGQMRRLHQLIVNGGFTSRQNQTSTAMMVLLLSTALFLIPGMRDSHESQKSELDITQAIKMPPMPGQSRSLLHFTPTIKEEYEDDITTQNVHTKVEQQQEAIPYTDHDYFAVRSQSPQQKKTSYIEADVPPQGYGFMEDTFDAGGKMEEEDSMPIERKLNVNVTGAGGEGMRTVVLHVPKEIK